MESADKLGVFTPPKTKFGPSGLLRIVFKVSSGADVAPRKPCAYPNCLTIDAHESLACSAAM